MRSFYSRYNPLKEAESFVEASLSGKHPSIVFILGGGKNYIGKVIKDKFPGTKRVLLEPDNFFLGQYENNSYDYLWNPSSKENLEYFFCNVFETNSTAGGIAVLEWKSITSVFPEMTKNIKAVLVRFLEKESSIQSTTAYWSRIWLRNTIRTSLFIKKIVPIQSIVSDKAIVIICAGSSLCQNINFLIEHRQKISIWCLASALKTLSDYNIKPDLVISTDPGFWNSFHLRALNNDTLLACDINSNIPFQILECNKIIPLSQNNLYSSIFNSACKNLPNFISASGSAAGTALNLASVCTKEKIYLLSYDLAAFDLLDHAHSYAFETLEQEKECRLKPFYSNRFSKVIENFPTQNGKWRFSRAFNTYSNEIAPQKADINRIKKISPSPVITAIQNEDIVKVENYFSTKPLNNATKLSNTYYENTETLSNKILNIKTQLTKIIENETHTYIECLHDSIKLSEISELLFGALCPNNFPYFSAMCARGLINKVDIDKIKTEAILSLEKLMDKNYE